MKKTITIAITAFILLGVYIYQEYKVNALKNEILGVERALDNSYQPTEIEQKEIKLEHNRVQRRNIQTEIDKLQKQIDVKVEEKRMLNREADEVKKYINDYYGMGL